MFFRHSYSAFIAFVQVSAVDRQDAGLMDFACRRPNSFLRTCTSETIPSSADAACRRQLGHRHWNWQCDCFAIHAILAL